MHTNPYGDRIGPPVAAIALQALALVACPGDFAAGGESPVEEMSLVLHDAVWRDEPDAPRVPIVLDFVRRGRAWEAEVVGLAERYNHAIHFGRLAEMEAADDKLHLLVRMRIVPDPWRRGGDAEYDIKLRRKAGELAGTYTGLFNGAAIRGAAEGRIGKTARPVAQAHVPLAPGEHPRLLCRRADIPALRARAKTPAGRQWVQRLHEALDRPGHRTNRAAGLGFLYVLTGEEAYAAKAREELQADLKASRNWTARGGPHYLARQAVEAAIAYDLIHDACDDACRKQMNALFTGHLPGLYGVGRPRVSWGNWNLPSNWNALYRSGLGVAALLLLGQPCDPPPAPPEPPDKAPPAADAQHAERWAALRRRVHAAQLANWQDDHAAWKAGRNPTAERWLDVAQRLVGAFCSRSLGDGGWNCEGDCYTRWALRLVYPFACAYRNVTGRDLAAEPNAGTTLVLAVAKTMLGKEHAHATDYGRGGGPLDPNLFARGFTLVPARLKPAVLWTWNRTQALSDGKRLRNANYSPADAQLDALSAVFGFLNHPAGLAEQNPGELLPRVYVDRQRGGYVFRNRWRDEDDFVAMIYRNADLPFGGFWTASDVGEFRISGLGVDWAVRGGSFASGRQGARHTNMVWLSDELLRSGGLAAAELHLRRADDGSGAVSLDMSPACVGAEKWTPSAHPGRPPTPRGKADIGIRAIRCFAADYSGRCGAPGLFVVADRFTGGKGEAIWQLVTHAGKKVRTEANTFTIEAPDGATLAGTVIAPATAPAGKPRLDVERVTKRQEINFSQNHIGRTFTFDCIQLHGRGQFLVVMTVQRADPPKVTATGAGLDAIIRVGKQTVRFDGSRLLLGK